MTSLLFTPARLGPITLRNRSIRSAAFEGMCPDHLVSDDLIRYHASVAAGGIGMTTVAYASVSLSGLSFPHQLWIRDDAVAGMRKLTDAVHSNGTAAAIQIGHCGLMATRSVSGECVAPTGKFNLYGPTWSATMSRQMIHDTVRDFANAVRLVKESGFDAFELHAGHGYLISQFLSPWTNKRKDEYGGSFENRSRFLTEVVRAVREACGAGLALLVKMNMSDGFPDGITWEDAAATARLLEKEGADALVLSGGFVSKAPLYVMRGRIPSNVMARYMKNPFMRMGTALFGSMLMKSEPFTEGYFLEDALKMRAEVDLPLVYVGGLKSREMIESVLNQGFQFVQIARALIRDPEFINKLKSGELERSDCDSSNYCIARMYSGSMVCHQNIPEGLEDLNRRF